MNFAWNCTGNYQSKSVFLRTGETSNSAIRGHCCATASKPGFVKNTELSGTGAPCRQAVCRCSVLESLAAQFQASRKLWMRLIYFCRTSEATVGRKRGAFWNGLPNRIAVYSNKRLFFFSYVTLCPQLARTIVLVLQVPPESFIRRTLAE